MKKIVVALALALVVGTSTASASTHHPIACFRAHHWRVSGTDRRGRAYPRPIDAQRFVRWARIDVSARVPYVIIDSVARAQRHVVKMCLGAT